MEEIDDEILRDPTLATTPAKASQQQPKQTQEQEEEGSLLGDIALAPFRGLEGTLNGVYNLADMALFDVLPDWDTRFLGKSKTTAGSLVEGISQFAFGFGPVFGALGKVGAVAKGGKAVQVARGVTAGAITDFSAFNGQEERLSNFLRQFPELQNPVTEFLAHDANETEVEGRIKNVLEGLILEGAIGGTVTLFMKSLRAIKKGKRARDVDGKGPDEVNKIVAEEAPKPAEIYTADEDRLARLREEEEFDEAFREVEEAKVQEDPTELLERKTKQYEDTKLLGGDKDLVVKIATENTNDPIHLSNKESIEFTDIKQIDDSDSPSVNKPQGLYYAKGDKWLGHIQDAAPAMARRGKNAHKLELNEDVIFKLDNTNIKEFEDKYLIKTDFEPGDKIKDNWVEDELGNFVNKFTVVKKGDPGYGAGSDALTVRIDWNKVVKDYSGLEIDLDSFDVKPEWTKGWDISQGIIWDKKAFKSASKVTKETPPSTIEEPTAKPDQEKTQPSTKRREGPLEFGAKFKELPDFKKGKEPISSKLESDPKFLAWKDSTLKGAKPSLPRMETTDDVDSIYTILKEKYKRNPELVEKFKDEPVDFFDEELNQMFKVAQKSIKDQREIRVAAEVFKDILGDSTEKLMSIVEEFKKTESIQSEAALRNQLREVVEVYDYYRQMGKETAITLAMRRSKRPISRKIGLETSEMQNSALVREFLNNNAGKMSAKKAVTLLENLYKPNDPEATLKGILDLSKKSQGNKLLDATIEYWTNSILSGPRTQAVNFLGNLLTQVLSSLEMTAGAVLTGNMPLAKAAFASTFDFLLVKEARRNAMKTLVTGKEVLDPGSRSFEANMQAIGQSIDFSKDGVLDEKFINMLGTFINLPARGLLTGDELFKQLAFRRAARLKASMEALNLGIKDPKEIAAYIEDRLNKVVTLGGQTMSEEALIREGAEAADKLGLVGKDNAEKRANFINKYVEDNFDEDGSTLAQYAIEEARYYTFTKELEDKTIGKGFQNLTNNVPILKFVLPFVRTPSNIISFALERSPLVFGIPLPGAKNTKGQRNLLTFPTLKSEAESIREGFSSNDPIVKAQTYGKMVTSFSTVMVFWDSVFNNNNVTPVITGGGPTDEGQKKILEQTGWRPYSIKIDGKYYSYQRLDPIATLLGIAADMSEMTKETPEYDQDRFEQIVVGTATALARNISNKSFLAGIEMWTQAFNDPDRFGAKLGQNYSSSFVPNVLSQMQDYDKESLREVRSWTDALMKKTPGGRDMLDPQRNILGEEKTIDYGTLGAINPIMTSEEKEDFVLQEMAKLKHGFKNPTNKILQGNIDLLNYVNSQGRTAHDRRLDLLQTVRIRGRTLRKTLEKLMKSARYQKMPEVSDELGFDSPRVEEINKVLRKFRELANREMYKEFPELSRDKNRITRALQLNRRGIAPQDVLELLQQTN